MIFLRLFARLRSAGPAAALLLVLLQRTPVVRVLFAAERGLASPLAQLLRAAFAPAAALGAVRTLAGATTQLVANTTLPARATVGQPFAMSVAITGLGVSFAQSWDVTNTLPPGVTPVGGVLQSGQYVVSPSTGTLTLSGTPTVAGTYSFTARGYQYAGRTGPVTTGATSIVVAAAPNSAPTITRQPAAQAASAGGSVTLSVTYTGTPAPTFQWSKNGTPIAGAAGPTLTLSNVTAADTGNYAVTITNSLGSVTSTGATVTINAAPAAPTFAAAPIAQTTSAGGAVIFSVEAVGIPVPTLQWMKDGINLPGATAATLILNDVQTTDAGMYAVAASNASGVAMSNAARLIVNALAAPPVFIVEPAPLQVVRGSTVVLNAAAAGTPSPSYQWQRDGVNLPGATGTLLVLANATAADAGAYTVVATNSSGAVVSTAAALSLATANPGRLINLSILTTLAADETMAIGTVLGGSGTAGSKALLARAAGPSLLPLGVTGVLPDPQIALLAGSGAIVAANNDWSGTAALSAAFSQVGAFAYAAANSTDAAILQPALAAGNYTLQVKGSGVGSGVMIAELYDATPVGVLSAATPRLINVSVMKDIPAGGSLSVGFVIGGATARTVLVRAIGPGLAPFGVFNTMADPQLALFAGARRLEENDNWGGDEVLTNVGASVGAFALANPASKDAMLLVTLAPGNYSAQVSGATGGGTVLVEVYEVP